MKAGRELDALVAEKVMGCDVAKILHYGYQGHYRYRCDCPGANSPDLRRHADEGFDGDVKPYSTDIAAAMEIVPEMNRRGLTLVLGITASGANAKFTGLISGQWDAPEPTAATAPLAICLAALKALGVEVTAPR